MGRSFDTSAIRFINIFRDIPSSKLISDAEMNIIKIQTGQHILPTTIPSENIRPNSYLIQPSTAFIDYAIDELRITASKRSAWLTKLLKLSILSISPIFRMTKLDDQVQVNNWMLSTNHPPDLSIVEIENLVNTLTTNYPLRPIVIRSINEDLNPELVTKLTQAGFNLLPNRMIYIQRLHASEKLPKNSRWDRKCWYDSGLTLKTADQFSTADYETATQLYNKLYLEKYSYLNPHYTAEFLKRAAQANFIHLKAIYDDEDRMLGVIGVHIRLGVLSCPIVGYDTDLPQEKGIYRMLMSLASTHAQELGIPFNMSAGADSFKRLRGGTPTIEYMAVYAKHMPIIPRTILSFFEFVLRRFGINILEASVK